MCGLSARTRRACSSATWEGIEATVLRGQLLGVGHADLVLLNAVRLLVQRPHEQVATKRLESAANEP